MGAEFFGQIGQSFENISRDAFQQQQIINDRQNALDALELTNNFKIDLGAEELTARNNYNFDGTYTNAATERFDRFKEKTLSSIKNDKVKRRVSENLERYRGEFNLSNLAFQNGAQQVKQAEQLDDALSIEVGYLSMNPDRGQVDSSFESLRPTFESLPPDRRVQAEQEIKDKLFNSYFETKANRAYSAYANGGITAQEFANTFDQILEEVGSSNNDISSGFRGSLIQAYGNRKTSALKNLRGVNKQAAQSRWNANIALQNSGKVDLGQEELDNYIRFLDTPTEKEAATLTFKVSKEQGALLNAIQAGDNEGAISKINEFEALRDKALAANDPVKARTYDLAFTNLTAAYKKQIKSINENAAEAFAGDQELQFQKQNNTTAYVNNLVAKASGLGVRPENVKFLTSAERSGLKSLMLSSDYDGIKEQITNLEKKYNTASEMLPEGMTAFDSIMGDLIADGDVPDTTKGFLLYGTQGEFGNQIMDILRTEVPNNTEKAYGKSKSEILEKARKRLKTYTKALAGNGDLLGSNNFITDNLNIITDLVFRSDYSPNAKQSLGIDSADKAIKKMVDITIGANYSVERNNKGQSILLHNKFAGNEEYKRILKDQTFFRGFVNNEISSLLNRSMLDKDTVSVPDVLQDANAAVVDRINQRVDAEYAKRKNKAKAGWENDITKLTPEDRKSVIYKETFNKVLLRQILDTGNFKPIHNTGTARLYVNYGGIEMPLTLTDNEGQTIHFDINSSDEGLSIAKALAGTLNTRPRTVLDDLSAGGRF